MTLQYVKGDATRPILTGGAHGLIVHVNNDRQGWGRGFVLAVSARWPQPEAAYRKWGREGINSLGEPFELGQIQVVQVEPNLAVVNMLAQSGYGRGNLNPHQTSEPNSQTPLRLDALAACLSKVAIEAKVRGASVHMPRIGTGLGGSSWDLIEPIVSTQLTGLSVTVYDFVP